MNQPNQQEKTLGAGFVVLSALFYATYGIWTTLLGDFMSGYTASAIRSVMVVILLLPIALFRKQLQPLNLSKTWKKILGMTIASAMVWGLLYYSVLNVGVGVSATVNYGAITIGMVFFGWLLAGEKFTIKMKLSLLIGIIGLSFIFAQTQTGALKFLPLAAAVVSGLAIAVNSILAKQLPYNTTQRTLVMWVVSVIANTPMIFILNEKVPSFNFEIEWFYLVMFAVSSILASWTLLAGLKYIEAGLAGILGLLEIAFGVFFGIVLFDEVLYPLTIIGVTIILISAAFPYLYDRNKKVKS